MVKNPRTMPAISNEIAGVLGFGEAVGCWLLAVGCWQKHAGRSKKTMCSIGDCVNHI